VKHCLRAKLRLWRSSWLVSKYKIWVHNKIQKGLYYLYTYFLSCDIATNIIYYLMFSFFFLLSYHCFVIIIKYFSSIERYKEKNFYYLVFCYSRSIFVFQVSISFLSLFSKLSIFLIYLICTYLFVYNCKVAWRLCFSDLFTLVYFYSHHCYLLGMENRIGDWQV